MVADTSDEPAGANCTNGGIKFSWGVDDNGNGALDTGEVDGTKYICNGSSGSAGHQALVKTSAEAAGSNCAAGGLRVDHGIDDNSNGTLDTAEIDATDYVCNPAKSLIATSAEPAGGNCANGGTKIDAGVDDNNDGTLQTGEIDTTEYACNGSNGLKSVVKTAFEAPGANCTAGGTRVDYGVDDNNNNTLESGEIDGSSFVCDGGAIMNSTPGAVTPQTITGFGCGTRFNVGAQDVVVRRIGALNQLGSAGNIKYVIMNHNAADAVLLTTPAKAVAADAAAASWKYSDPVSFTLTAGGSYCIAAITDLASIGARYDQVAETAAGLTSAQTNPNIVNFASPTISPGGAAAPHGIVDCGIQVLTY